VDDKKTDDASPSLSITISDAADKWLDGDLGTDEAVRQQRGVPLVKLSLAELKKQEELGADRHYPKPPPYTALGSHQTVFINGFGNTPAVSVDTQQETEKWSFLALILFCGRNSLVCAKLPLGLVLYCLIKGFNTGKDLLNKATDCCLHSRNQKL